MLLITLLSKKETGFVKLNLHPEVKIVNLFITFRHGSRVSNKPIRIRYICNDYSQQKGKSSFRSFAFHYCPGVNEANNIIILHMHIYRVSYILLNWLCLNVMQKLIFFRKYKKLFHFDVNPPEFPIFFVKKS